MSRDQLGVEHFLIGKVFFKANCTICISFQLRLIPQQKYYDEEYELSDKNAVET